MDQVDIHGLDELPKNERVIIYGTGLGGKMVAGLIWNLRGDVDIVGYADSFAAGELDGLRIYRADELPGVEFDRILICSHRAEEIAEGLRAMGIDRFQAFTPLLKDHASWPVLPGQCAVERPYIACDGSVYPCCRKRYEPETIIGRIGDADIIEKIAAYDMACRCDDFVFRSCGGKIPSKLGIVTVEPSLSCQAGCAMCCAHSPEWRGIRDLSPELEASLDRFFSENVPEMIHVQGGEVLVHPKGLDWLLKLRERLPDVCFSIITNGCVGDAVTEKAGRIFDKVGVSLVGFQPETYRAVMQLDYDRTMRFINRMHALERVELSPKFLVTPSTMHETAAFLEWGMVGGFPTLALDASNIAKEVNFASREGYWLKMIARSGRSARAVMKKHGADYARTGGKIWFTSAIRELLHINDEFINENGLADVLIPFNVAWENWGRLG